MKIEEALDCYKISAEITLELQKSLFAILSNYDVKYRISPVIMPALIIFLSATLKKFDKEGRKGIFDSLMRSLNKLESTIMSDDNKEENVSVTVN